MSPLARLFYVSLWCEADREGRMEWKPRTFKLRYLPGDNCCIEDLADELVGNGLVVLYTVDGKQYAEVPSFKRHQIINNRESESVIPPRVDDQNDASFTRESGDQAEGKGKEGKEGKGKEGRNPAASVADGHRAPPCPHQEIIALYHELLPTGTQVRVWNDTREKALQARWREDAKRQDLEWWRRFFAYVAESEFLTGQTQPANGRDPFVVSLDWLISPQNFAKTIEGKYHRSAA